MNSTKGFLCGTPGEFCSGGKLPTDQHLKAHTVHHSREEAFKCYARYLVNQKGYTLKNSREFHKEGEPILMLSKKSHFGGAMRGGKSENQKAKRLMPKKGRGLIY